MNDASVALNPAVNQASISSSTSSAIANDAPIIAAPPAAAPAPAAPPAAESRRYSMVALDLDGTLLQSDHRMSPEQAAYLRYLDSCGFVICLATGRAAPSVYEHVQALALPHPVPVVCSNGARACLMTASAAAAPDPATASTTAHHHHHHQAVIDVEELFFLPVSNDTARSTIKLAKSMGYCMHFYIDDKIYGNPTTPTHHKQLEDYTAVVGSVVQHVGDDFEGLLSSSSSSSSTTSLPSKLLVRFEKGHVDDAYGAFQKLLQPADGPRRATIIRGYAPTLDYFLEILHPDVNKGHGLRRLLPMLNDRRKMLSSTTTTTTSDDDNNNNLDLSQVIAMGDGTNDVEFLQVAGLGIAMKNAHPEVLRVMSNIMEKEESYSDNSRVGRIMSWTNDEHGVMKTLQALEARGQLDLTIKTE